jgi:hypothetical protein
MGKAFWPGSPAGILLARSAESGTWQRVGQQKPVSSADYLVSLPGYRSEIQLDHGVILQLWGNLPEFSRQPPSLESAVIVHADPALDLDFTLDHGRAVVVNRKPRGAAKVRLRFRNEVCDLTLPGRDTEMAVELFTSCPPYSPEPRKEPPTHVRMYALRGQAQVVTRVGQHSMSGFSLFEWDNAAGFAAHPTEIPRPDWWTARPLIQTSAARDMDLALDGLSRRLTATDRVEISFAEAVKDSDSTKRVLAVRFLGAMDEPAKLLDCLADEQHYEIRFTAIDELRHLLALNSQNDEKLATLLKQKNYSDVQAQIALQLLHDFSREEWSDPATRATVVSYLTNEKLAIRQLAHTRLMALIPDGQRIRYDAAASGDQRSRGAREWQKITGAGVPKPKSDQAK